MYKLLKSLSVPSQLADETLQELVWMMTNHQDPKPNLVAERFKFDNCDRQRGESRIEHIAKLQRLAEHWNYGTIHQDILWDWLVCGLKHERI